MLLDEEVLIEGISDKKIERMRKTLETTYSPNKLVVNRSRKYGSAMLKGIISSIFGIMCCALFGVGWYSIGGIAPIDREKLYFKLKLVNSDPDCTKWAKECENACNDNPPDKEKAKYAYKKFKEAFKALDHERQWKQYKRENK